MAEITNKDIYKLINKLDTKISKIETNLSDKIKANSDLTDELAVITNKGFDMIDKQNRIMGQRFVTFEELLKDIKLRLNECAYGFEVKDLTRRVNVVESKIQKLETSR